VAEEGIDIIVMIQKGGDMISGESQSLVNSSDLLTKDFVKGKYFEVEDLDFGVKLSDRDSSRKASRRDADNRTVTDATEEAGGGPFAKFIDGTIPLAQANGDGPPVYPVTFDEVSISRKLDCASPILFKACATTAALTQVTVVKRKTAGRADGGLAVGIKNIAYFRVEFQDVLVTDIGWSVSDVLIREKMKFVCRRITMKYRPQLSDGRPGDIISIGPLALRKTSAPGK
jgi:type VI protein secretion system component Hcp